MNSSTTHLTVNDVLAAGAVAIGAPPAVRDLGLLDSAAAQTYASAFGADAYPNVYHKAAALLRSIVNNHALVDGNKRTALAATLLFMEMNGQHVAVTNDARDWAYDMVLRVAAGVGDLNMIAADLAYVSRQEDRDGFR